MSHVKQSVIKVQSRTNKETSHAPDDRSVGKQAFHGALYKMKNIQM